MAASSAVAVNFREATFDDYDHIAALQRRSGLSMKRREDWLHLWRDNPAYKRRPGWPIGWVLEHPEQGIVGSVNNIPLDYELDGERLTVSAGRGWAADPPYRGYSALLIDELLNQPGVDLFLNTTVNPNAADAFRQFECSPVPAGQWDRSLFWITNYRVFAERALRHLGWRAAAGPASYPAATALYVQDVFRGARRIPSGLEIGVESTFDGRFDDFWRELRQERRHQLIAVRTREVLEWHFQPERGADRAHVFTAARNGRLRAYAIFARKDNDKYRMKRMRLIDYQSLDDDRECLLAMLARAVDICRSTGVHLLEDVGCCLQGAPGARVRNLESWRYYYKVPDATLHATLKDPARWRPSLFDGDSSL